MLEVNVIVKYSYYRKYLNDRDYAGVAMADGATLKDLVEHLGIGETMVRQITVNEEVKEPDTVLSDGDSVVIWPPLIGGG